MSLEDNSSNWLTANTVAIVVIVVVVAVTTFVCTIIAKLISYKFFESKKGGKKRNRRNRFRKHGNIVKTPDSDSEESDANNNFRQWYGQKSRREHYFCPKCNSMNPFEWKAKHPTSFQRPPHITEGNLRLAASDLNLSQKLGIGIANVEPFNTFMRQLEDKNLSPMPQTPPRQRNAVARVPLRDKFGLNLPSSSSTFPPIISRNVFVRLEDEFNKVSDENFLPSSGSDSVFLHDMRNLINVHAEVHKTAGSSLTKSQTKQQQSPNSNSNLLQTDAVQQSPVSVYFSPDGQVTQDSGPSKSGDQSPTPDVVPTIVSKTDPVQYSAAADKWGRPGNTGPMPRRITVCYSEGKQSPPNVLNKNETQEEFQSSRTDEVENTFSCLEQQQQLKAGLNEASIKNVSDLSFSSSSSSSIKSKIHQTQKPGSGQLMVLASIPSRLLPELDVQCSHCGHEVKSSKVSKNGGSEWAVLKWLRFSSGRISSNRRINKPVVSLSSTKRGNAGNGQKTTCLGGYDHLV